MELTSAYIPIDRRRAMARGESLSDRLYGAVLFADISGFTQLTDALLRVFGPRRGSDELTKQLNQLYDALIQQAHTYHGSVINFSGDAITCWFDQDDGLRATACGLAMQQVMNEFTTLELPKRGRIPLSLKVAIAGGATRRFLVGDPQIQWIDVLAGATLERAAAAEQYARKGEVLLSQELIIGLGDQIDIDRWRGKTKKQKETDSNYFGVVGGLTVAVEPDPWPADFGFEVNTSNEGFDEAQIRPWLLPPVYQSLRSNRGEFLAEIRPAVALFLKFTGLDYDHDEAAGEKLDAFIRWAQNILVGYDSYIMQLLVGDKGSYLYAIFGAPLAHDNDPERAVAAALELQTAPQQFDFITQVQLGLNQGRVRAGAYGSAARRTYGVLGDGVNIAARLMSQAEPGQILVSQSIVEATSASYYFKPLGPIKFKGKQKPLLVSLALSPRSFSPQRLLASFNSPLVGRRDPLRQLEQILADTLAGQKQVVWVEGPTGIGKSHLATELAERALQQRVRVVVGSCQSMSQAVMYYPWQQIFRTLLGLSDERSPRLSQEERLARQADQLKAIVTKMNQDWLIRLPLLGDLLGLLILDNPTTAAFEPQLRQMALFDLAEEMLKVWAQEQPLLVLIEDAHWLDEASQALMLSLGRARLKLPLLFILTQGLPITQVEQERLRQEFSRLPQVHSIRLGELSPPEAAEIIAQRLQGDISPLALELIQTQAQGNPLFTRILADALQEAGNLRRQSDGRWELSEATFEALQQANCLTKQEGQWRLDEQAPLSATNLDLPDSIHSIVLARLDHLAEPLKATLKVASVIGRLFELDLLAQAHPGRPGLAALLEQLEQLQKLDFIRAGSGQVYLFKHNITHEVTYATLIEQQEHSLHRAVAEVLERRQPEAVERLAYHYSHAGAPAKMLYYLDLAAGKTQQEYANETALAYYTRALAVTEYWRWRKGQAEILHILGRREEERATLQTLAANLETPTFEVGYLWGQYYEATGDYTKAQAAIELALTDSHDKKDTVNKAHCLACLGLIARRQGNYEQAKTWYQPVLNLFESKRLYTDREVRALTQAFNGLGAVCRQQGDFDHAQTYHERALALSRRTGDRAEEAQAYNDLGGIFFYRRRLTETLAYHRQALDIRRAIGDRAGEGVSLANLAQVACTAGDYGQAQKYMLEALNILQATGNRWDEANTWNTLGVLYQELGDLPQAETCLRQGLAITRAIGDEAGQAYILANLGLVARDKGEPEIAKNLLAAGLALAQAQNDQYLVSSFLNYLSTVNLQQGKLDEAIVQADSSLALRRELKIRLVTPDNLATLAAAYLAAGDSTRALAYAAETQTLLEECGGEGPEFPQRDYFIVSQVLAAASRDQEAQATLQAAYDVVLARAEKIIDPSLRQSFLEQVVSNKVIIASYLGK